ncbi:hypothetical protein, partial [Halosegnis sp.]|uniref:hypothetical protein n=1 Tax=Halosegnis sp. TaxID=2864959 RepID=UPI0035D49D84
MSHATRLFALFGAALLLVSVAAPAVAAQEGDLSVGVTQDGDDVTIAVTQNDTGVENATVEVNVTEGNATYEGPYTTDADGEVELDAPEENVAIAVTATYENQTANATAELTNATLAESDENETDAFGQEVAALISSLLKEDGAQGGIGGIVSEYVVENNPGNADNATDDAGPPENVTDDAGPPENATDSDDEGPPENATDSDDEGPPENATDSDDEGPPENAGDEGEDAGDEGEDAGD